MQWRSSSSGQFIVSAERARISTLNSRQSVALSAECSVQCPPSPLSTSPPVLCALTSPHSSVLRRSIVASSLISPSPHHCHSHFELSFAHRTVHRSPASLLCTGLPSLHFTDLVMPSVTLADLPTDDMATLSSAWPCS